MRAWHQKNLINTVGYRTFVRILEGNLRVSQNVPKRPDFPFLRNVNIFQQCLASSREKMQTSSRPGAFFSLSRGPAQDLVACLPAGKCRFIRDENSKENKPLTLPCYEDGMVMSSANEHWLLADNVRRQRLYKIEEWQPACLHLCNLAIP